jgi:predicted DNA-binding transcriptional regulator AlpA
MLLTVDDVLREIRVSRVTFYGMLKRGEFPEPTRIGRRTMWEPAVVRAWVESRRPASRAFGSAGLLAPVGGR